MKKKVKRWVSAAMLLLFCVCGYAQTISVKGTIIDQGNIPMPGVNVTIQGTTKGVVTDIDGKYTVEVPSNSSLVFSFVGYLSQTLVVEGRTIIDVTMVEDVQKIDEVVVIGYGTARKRDLTGAVTQVKTSQLEIQKPMSVQDVLRGRVAGLNVGFNAEAKGGGNLEVRGTKSIRGDATDAAAARKDTREANYPLIVLDGVIYSGALEDINPNDIETIDLLKDASSAAVYGAKAASGVLAITTKRGSAGKPVINVNASVGISQLATMPEVYGPHEFLDWRTDVFQSINRYGNNKDKLYIYENPNNLPAGVTTEMWMDGATGDPVNVWLTRLNLNSIEQKNYHAGVSNNWRDVAFRNGFNQDYNISLSGRKEEVSYYWSLGYNETQGVRVGDDYNIYRSRLNVNGNVTDFLTVGANVQFSFRDESGIGSNWGGVKGSSPWGSYYTDDGKNIRTSPVDDAGGRGAWHPLHDLTYNDRLKTYNNLNADLYAKLKLPFGFSYQINYAPHWNWYAYYNHQMTGSTEYKSKGGQAIREQSNIFEWSVDNLVKWNKIFGHHSFDLTLLANAEKYQYWQDKMTVEGFVPNDALHYHQVASGTTTVNESNDEYSTADAYMARLIYSFKNRYITTLSIRRDGYSAFGQANPRGTFVSAALGWVFSEENFVELPWLSFGKLRASWGTNGNRNVGRYSGFEKMTTGAGKYLYQSGSTVTETPQLYVDQMANVNLKWEETENLNFGLDFGLFDGRIDGNIDVYQMKTNDILLKRKLIYPDGFATITANSGIVKNTGIEFSINAGILDKENLKWRTGFNFSLNRNEILELYGDGKDDIINERFIGHALDEIWDWREIGVWQENEVDEAKKYNQWPGDFKLKDGGANQYKLENDDKEFLGFKEPRFRWFWNNDFNVFKNFDVSFTMYSYWGHYGTFNQAKNRDGFFDRINSYILPYYTPENPQTKYARLNSADAGGVGVDIWRKRSFIRLDNISVAYTLPKELVNKVKIQNLRIFATVRNVGFYAPEWELWDPETVNTDNAVQPSPRIWTFGVNVTL